MAEEIDHYMKKHPCPDPPGYVKKWGADERILRILVNALLIPKTTYGYSFYRLTKKQRESVEYLNREAMRVVSGLPRFAVVHNLHLHSGMNTIEDRAESLEASQLLRLESTQAGRAILRQLGHSLYQVP